MPGVAASVPTPVATPAPSMISPTPHGPRPAMVLQAVPPLGTQAKTTAGHTYAAESNRDPGRFVLAGRQVIIGIIEVEIPKK